MEQGHGQADVERGHGQADVERGHGQAVVEPGFSLIIAVLQSNVKHDSVVSKRLLQDHLVSNNLKPLTMEINSQLHTSRQQYHTHLEEEKKTTKQQSSDKAREIISMEIEELQGKISALDKSSTLLDQKFVSLWKNSEKCKNMLDILSEANALKRKSEEQVDDMRKPEETLKLLKEKKESCRIFIYLGFFRFVSSGHQVNLLLPI